MFSYDRKSGTVILPGKDGRKINATIEDIRLAIMDNDLALKYEEAIDKLNMMLNDSIKSISEGPRYDISDDFSSDFSDTGSIIPRAQNIGDKIEVFWPITATYYPGIVSNYDEAIGKHDIDYGDGDHETLDMKYEVWHPLQAN